MLYTNINYQAYCLTIMTDTNRADKQGKFKTDVGRQTYWTEKDEENITNIE